MEKFDFNDEGFVNKLSPMMKHYVGLKKEQGETIILYRLGDFYEMFFEDARQASRILDLTLTGRDCGLGERIPMCGVPHHAVDGYISKLIKAGKKVAICEQLSAPQDQKGMVKRGVVRIISAGTVTDDSMLDGTKNNYLTAVATINKSIGIASADITTGDVKVIELGKNNLDKFEDVLLSLAPSEIIADGDSIKIINNFESVKQNKLVVAEPYYSYSFDIENANETVCAFYKTFSITGLGLMADSVKVSALGALIKYIENTQKRDLSNMLKPRIMQFGKEMFLDYSTICNLELVESQGEKSKYGSLLWVLDKTKTNMGARLLRSWVQEPLQDLNAINHRLNAVEELTKDRVACEKLKLTLAEIRDIDRLCNKISMGTINPKECLTIADSLRQMPAVIEALSSKKSHYLVHCANSISLLEELVVLLDSAIYSSLSNEENENRIIKEGYNAELDEYRNIGKNAKLWLSEYEARLRAETNIKPLKVRYNRIFGYYIEVTNLYKDSVPDHFIRKQTLANGERFFTTELKEMEDKILHADEKYAVLELRLFSEIKATLLDVIDKLQVNSMSIAWIDSLRAIAEVAVVNKYVRPNISAQNTTIEIEGGRHPVVEAIKKSYEFVPNDTILSDAESTLIVTGPNMAGKSTYMRQVALIVLMAHIGSFVPADSAKICLVDRIFTRIGASDNLAYGQSTFMVEMTEMANILNNATNKSLLILDEVGRGTSTVDGLSIAWSIVEHISLKLKAKTLFATHYHEMSELESIAPNVKNYHVLISEGKNGITFLYKIARGGASKSFGIEVAELAGIHKDVISRAQMLMNAMTASDSSSTSVIKCIENATNANSTVVGQYGFFDDIDDKFREISSVLADINLKSCSPEEAYTILADLQKNFGAKKGKKKR
ncbi:MAG: DNA mismatch repair protein MutS [Bacillota bacterium]